jgi:hypothetical protein
LPGPSGPGHQPHRPRRPGRPTQDAPCRRRMDCVALPGLLRENDFPTGGSHRRHSLCLPSGHHPASAPAALARCARSRCTRSLPSTNSSPDRPLLQSPARRSSASRCRLRLDLIGALPMSEGARLPRIGASCVLADSSLSLRKSPSDHTTRVTGSHAPVDHSTGHKRSRRRLHQDADDLRPVDSRSWRQPSGLEFNTTPPHRDHTSTLDAVNNSFQLNDRNNRVPAKDSPLQKPESRHFGSFHGSSSLRVATMKLSG